VILGHNYRRFWQFYFSFFLSFWFVRTLKTVLHRLSKHVEFRQKILRCALYLQLFSRCLYILLKHYLSFLIYHIGLLQWLLHCRLAKQSKLLHNSWALALELMSKLGVVIKSQYLRRWLKTVVFLWEAWALTRNSALGITRSPEEPRESARDIKFAKLTTNMAARGLLRKPSFPPILFIFLKKAPVSRSGIYCSLLISLILQTTKAKRKHHSRVFA